MIVLKIFRVIAGETTCSFVKIVVWNKAQRVPNYITPAPLHLPQTKIPEAGFFATVWRQKVSSLGLVIVHHNVKANGWITLQTFLNLCSIAFAG
jgi:hypothetical protein